MQIINLSFCIRTQGHQEQIMVWLLCSFQENMIWSDSVFLLCPAKQPYGTVHGKNRHLWSAMFGFDQQLTSTLLFPGCSLAVPCLFPACSLAVCFSSPPKALCWHLARARSCCLGGGELEFPLFTADLLPVEDGKDCSSSGRWFLLVLWHLPPNSETDTAGKTCEQPLFPKDLSHKLCFFGFFPP